MRQSQPLVILIIISMAIILAVGLFLAVNYVQDRPVEPTGTEVIVVEGVEITVKTDPDKAMRVINLEQMPLDAGPQLGETGQQEPIQMPVQQEQTPIPTQEPPTPTPQPLPTAVPDPVIFESYLVQPNDSLYGIATRVDTSIALMARYNIAQDDLVPGTLIQLPVGNPAYCPQPDLQPYGVGEADTAYSIGRQFGVSSDDIRAYNGLDENFTVYGASIICVPRR